MFAPNKSPKIDTENFGLLQGDDDKFPMIVGDLNTPLSGTDKSRRHKRYSNFEKPTSWFNEHI